MKKKFVFTDAEVTLRSTRPIEVDCETQEDAELVAAEHLRTYGQTVNFIAAMPAGEDLEELVIKDFPLGVIPDHS